MRRPLCMICLSFVIAVFLFYQVYPMQVPDMGELAGQEVLLTGWVKSKEIKKDEIILFFEPTQVQTFSNSNQEQQFNTPIELEALYVQLGEVDTIQNEPQIGEYIQLSGILQEYQSATNPGEFDLRAYYAMNGISGRVKEPEIVKRYRDTAPLAAAKNRLLELLYQLRNKLAATVDHILPEKPAGMLKAMLLGIKSDMNAESKDLFQRSGIAHILAISGLHISLLGMGLYKLLRRLRIPNVVTVPFAVLFMFLYGVMTGMSNSAYRAILMFALQLGAILLRRTYDTLTALAIAAVLVLLERPLYLYNSGFLLSFCAVLGVALLSPFLQQLFQLSKIRQHLLQKALQAFLGSLSIQLFTLPVILYFYYEIPVYSILLNIIVLPFMPAVLVSGLSGMLSGSFALWLGRVLVFPMRIILQWYEYMCELSLQLPHSNWITGRPSVMQIVLYYGVLLGIIFLGDIYFRAREKNASAGGKWKVVVISSICAGIGASLFLLMIPFGNAALRVIFLDVGQGDGICILTEERECILIDGGSSSESDLAEYTLIPMLKYYGVSRVAYSIITHPDEDHCNGILDLLSMGRAEGIKVENLVLTEALQESEEVKELVEAAELVDTKLVWLEAGDVLTDGGLVLRCLYPDGDFTAEDTNAYSLVLLLDYLNFSALLTGDLGMTGEKEVLEALQQVPYWEGNCDVLKVGHHGSKNSTSAELLEGIEPRIAVISCGKSNRYGHPHSDLLDRLQTADVPCLTTPEHGAVLFHARNGQITVETFLSNVTYET